MVQDISTSVKMEWYLHMIQNPVYHNLLYVLADCCLSIEAIKPSKFALADNDRVFPVILCGTPLFCSIHYMKPAVG